MSVFNSIMSKIFGNREAAAAAVEASSAPQPAVGQQPSPTASPPAASAAAISPQDGAAQAAAPQQQPVDVEAVLTELASKTPQKLDWRHSIVDLMKLLRLDSGLGARRELARELGYGGDPGDSAAMNIWLHRQVMRKLAENGGRVPDDLRS
jgi:Domain of unknown function (DUF3597)